MEYFNTPIAKVDQGQLIQLEYQGSRPSQFTLREVLTSTHNTLNWRQIKKYF